MHASTLWALCALTASTLATPHVVHEKRSTYSDSHWQKTTEIDPEALLPVRIGLKQSNLDNGDAWLMDVADPTSKNYGKHWTAEQVIEAFKPSDDTINEVYRWLVDSGIEDHRHRLSEGKNWLEFTATGEELDRLLKAKYHVFTHVVSGVEHVACDEYSLPQHIQEHVDFISPGVHFAAKPAIPDEEAYDSHGRRLGKRQASGKKGFNFPHWTIPKLLQTPKLAPELTPAPSTCNDSFVTPACLRTLYQVPKDMSAASGNSIGIVEYTPQSYLQSDIDLFMKTYQPESEGDAPIFDAIDGGYLYRGYNESTASDYLLEPSLDLQYAMALVWPQKVTLYQVGDVPEQDLTSFNNFLDAIDASYCTYDGGDTPGEDATYPDKSSGSQSYKGKENCGTYAPAKVISTSYSYDEYALTPAYEVRQCHEYMKLGLMGTTFAYCSGDYGVAGYYGYCVDSNGQANNGMSGEFVPTFPNTCPYVLSVGATQIKNGTNDVAQAVAAGEEVEVAMELYLNSEGLITYDVPVDADTIGQIIFSSSGGFSNVFSLPSYQASAVQKYQKTYAPSYPGQYNASGNSRAFPDISSNGAWFNVAIDGEFGSVFGTSCAAPTVAALLGLINGERMKKGKSSVGFINPTLYSHPSVLNDITAGRNPGCGTEGFSSEPGWDPVTGLGTPNFPKMLSLFMSLP